MKDYLKSLTTREAFGQLVRVGIIGVVNTAVDFTLRNIVRFGFDWSTFWAVTVGFAVATAVSYVLNRAWTFQIRHHPMSVGETVNFYFVNGIAWIVTVGIVQGAEWWLGPLGPLGFNVAGVVAALVILVPKFASYRDLVFRDAISRDREHRAKG